MATYKTPGKPPHSSAGSQPGGASGPSYLPTIGSAQGEGRRGMKERVQNRAAAMASMYRTICRVAFRTLEYSQAVWWPSTIPESEAKVAMLNIPGISRRFFEVCWGRMVDGGAIQSQEGMVGLNPRTREIEGNRMRMVVSEELAEDERR